MNHRKKNSELDRWLSENEDFIVPKEEKPGRKGENKKKSSIVPQIDLHGLRVKQALVKLRGFIQSQSVSVKKIRIIHGKGNHKGENSGVLREEVRNWLKKQRESGKIKDFIYEKPENGGWGVTQVWLR
jgi:DNA-nicking Smr family endonuclease